MRKAQCVPEVPLHEELKAFFYKSPESDLLRVYPKLVDHEAYKDEDLGAKKQCRGIKKAQHCQLEKLFGEQNAWRIYYLIARYNLNASQYQIYDYESSERKAFTLSELNSLIRGFRSFPDKFFIERESSFGGTAFRVDSLGSNVMANAVMSYSDLWGSSSLEEQVFTVVHELGHVVDSGLTEDSRWEEFSRDEEGKKRDKFYVSDYATKNNSEDWAESVMYYRFAPGLLREVSPEKYETVRDLVFLGEEISRESGCRWGHGFRQDPEGLSNHAVNRLSFKGGDIDRCSFYSLGQALGLPVEKELNACLAETAHSRLLSNFIQSGDLSELAADFFRLIGGGHYQLSVDTHSFVIESAMKAILNEGTLSPAYLEFEKSCQSEIDEAREFVGDSCSYLTMVDYYIENDFENDLKSEFIYENLEFLTKACVEICKKQKLQAEEKTIGE